MSYLEQIFHLWTILYDKNHDPKSVIQELFHHDFTQCINGTVLNRCEYTHHVIAQRNHIQKMDFECKFHMAEHNQLFILYQATGQTIQGDDIVAEIISYFEFKDQKIFKIHGQVHLLKGSPSDVDMAQE
jgi:hypothetical protein